MTKRIALLLILQLLLSINSFTQSDSVYFYQNPSFNSDIEIITPKGKIGIRENYTHFKQVYWARSTDTVQLSELLSPSTPRKQKNMVQYLLYSNCDPIINEIRNRSYFWAMGKEIHDIERTEIGLINKEFMHFQYADSNTINNFHSQCFLTFKKEVEIIRERLLLKIQLIKKEKTTFNCLIHDNIDDLNHDLVSEFITTFNTCKIDFESLELMIVNNPIIFTDCVNNLTEHSFDYLTSKMSYFTPGFNVRPIKKSLKSIKNKTKRTKTLIKKVYSRKE